MFDHHEVQRWTVSNGQDDSGCGFPLGGKSFRRNRTVLPMDACTSPQWCRSHKYIPVAISESPGVEGHVVLREIEVRCRVEHVKAFNNFKLAIR